MLSDTYPAIASSFLIAGTTGSIHYVKHPAAPVFDDRCLNSTFEEPEFDDPDCANHKFILFADISCIIYFKYLCLLGHLVASFNLDIQARDCEIMAVPCI